MPLKHFTEGEGAISHSADKHLVLLHALQLFPVSCPHLSLAELGMWQCRHFNVRLLTTATVNGQEIKLAHVVFPSPVSLDF